MNLIKIIGLCHLFGVIIENSYGLIPQVNYYLDKIYLISFVSIPLSWLCFKDECLISYFIKKIENPKYKLGDTPNDIKDIAVFFKPNHYINFVFVNSFLRVLSVSIVNNRSLNISNYYLIPINSMYLFYSNDINFNLNLRKYLSPYFEIIFSFYLFSFLLLIYKK